MGGLERIDRRVYWWWPVYDRYPERVFVSGIICLIILLTLANLPILAGDFVHYPKDIRASYEGGSMFFPFVLSYLIIGVPHLLFEQRRQIDALGRWLRVKPHAMERVDKALVEGSFKSSSFALIFGLAAAFFYMNVQGLLVVEGLTSAAQIRRVIYFLMPVMMWALYYEAVSVMIRSASLTRRLVRVYSGNLQIHKLMLRPVKRIFINCAFFTTFGMAGLPILWFSTVFNGLDIILFASLILAVAGCLSRIIFNISGHIGSLQVATVTTALEDKETMEDRYSELVEDTFLSRLLTTGASAIWPRLRGTPVLALRVLQIRFWSIMLMPFIIWGGVIAATWTLTAYL